MPIVECLFQEIVKDFIKDLSESEDYNSIFVVIGHFTKVQHYMEGKTT